MLHADQIKLGHQLLDCIDTRSIAMAPDLYRQPVHGYISADIAATEQRRLFRALPICVGLSDLLTQAGRYVYPRHCTTEHRASQTGDAVRDWRCLQGFRLHP